MPQIWGTGSADDVWKVMICAREADRAENMLLSLDGITRGAQPAARTYQEAATRLRALTGGELMDAVLQYHQSNYDSVQNALKEKK